MAAPFLRSLRIFLQRLYFRRSTIGALTLGRPWSTLTESGRPDDSAATPTTHNVPVVSSKDPPKHPRFDIKAVTSRVKDILHSTRYMDGERLSADDEKMVVERLVVYHPNSEDKIGCGIDSIMVDRHPQLKSSRCLFVVRSDGGWIDFSYKKCLRAYKLSRGGRVISRAKRPESSLVKLFRPMSVRCNSTP